MSSSCCNNSVAPGNSPNDLKFRRVLWIALVINAVMFVVELYAGILANSSALLADSADFLGDSANYAITLIVLPLAKVWRSRTALLKGLTMTLFALAILTFAVVNAFSQTIPAAITMGTVGFAALVANIFVAYLLYTFRDGDANSRSVWLCSRNDAISNIAVIFAAIAVFVFENRWPDIVVALLIGGLVLHSGISVLRQAYQELKDNNREST